MSVQTPNPFELLQEGPSQKDRKKAEKKAVAEKKKAEQQQQQQAPQQQQSKPAHTNNKRGGDSKGRRGRGEGRGGSGKRPFDRHPQNGYGKDVSKGGHGRGNWGDNQDEVANATEAPVAVVEEPVAAPVAEEPVVDEEDASIKTLEQYQASLQAVEDDANIQIREVENDEKLWKAATPIVREVEEKSQGVKKVAPKKKQVVNLFEFNEKASSQAAPFRGERSERSDRSERPPRRENRGERSERSERGDRSERGERSERPPRGGARGGAPRGGAPRAPRVALNNEKDFPSL